MDYEEELPAELDFMKQARADLEFDMTNIDRISLKIPMLTEKYARMMMEFKSDMKLAEIEFKKVEAEMYEYYMAHYPLKVDRRDLATIIWKDEKYQMAAKRLEVHKMKVEYMQTILNALSSASYNIGNAIKIHIFNSGGMG